ncbi:unnamed protein product [Ixodes pacificus]
MLSRGLETGSVALRGGVLSRDFFHQVTSELFPANTGGAAALCQELGLPFLGSLPLDPTLAKACDEGVPFLRQFPEAPAARACTQLVQNLLGRLTGGDIRS